MRGFAKVTVQSLHRNKNGDHGLWKEIAEEVRKDDDGLFKVIGGHMLCFHTLQRFASVLNHYKLSIFFFIHLESTHKFLWYHRMVKFKSEQKSWWLEVIKYMHMNHKSIKLVYWCIMFIINSSWFSNLCVPQACNTSACSSL